MSSYFRAGVRKNRPETNINSSQITVRPPDITSVLTLHCNTTAGNMKFAPLDVKQIRRCHSRLAVFLKSRPSSRKQRAACQANF